MDLILPQHYVRLYILWPALIKCVSYYFQVQLFVPKAFKQLSIFHAIFEDILSHLNQTNEEHKIVKKIEAMNGKIDKLKRLARSSTVSDSFVAILAKFHMSSVCFKCAQFLTCPLMLFVFTPSDLPPYVTRLYLVRFPCMCIGTFRFLDEHDYEEEISSTLSSASACISTILAGNAMTFLLRFYRECGNDIN